MRYDPPRPWRPRSDQPAVTWEDVRPHELRDNPEYAMYRAVLEAIAELLGPEKP
jgi:hypothetical protein